MSLDLQTCLGIDRYGVRPFTGSRNVPRSKQLQLYTAILVSLTAFAILVQQAFRHGKLPLFTVTLAIALIVWRKVQKPD